MATKTKTPLDTLADVKSLTPIKNTTKVTGKEKIISKSKAHPAVETPVKPDYLAMKTSDRNAAILERSREVVNLLRGVGLQAVAYDRAPIGPLVFTMGLDNNAEVYRFWTGNANVEVIDAVSEPKRQAVIRVKEDAHKIVHKFKRNGHVSEHHLSQNNKAAILASGPSAASVVPSAFPTGTKLVMRDLQYKTLDMRTRAGMNVSWSGEVHISVPKFDNCYLIGYDENKCFISQLPNSVDSVAAAIKALQPAGLVKGHIRQGEWFFNPCSQAEITTIEDHIKKMRKPGSVRINYWEAQSNTWWHAHGITKPKADYQRQTVAYGPLETNSSHRAEYQVTISGTQYVKGNVIDTRSGRHAPILLDDWHRVIRNREVIQTATTNGTRPARRWD